MNIINIKFWNFFYKKPINYLLSLSNDKLLHFMISMILVQIFYLCTNHISIALIITLGIGIFKEVIIDKYLMKTKIDLDDLKLDLLGCWGGFVMSLLIYILH